MGIRSALDLGVGYEYYLDLYIINLTVQALCGFSNYFWAIYLVVPGYLMFYGLKFLLAWANSTGTQPEETEEDVKKKKKTKVNYTPKGQILDSIHNILSQDLIDIVELKKIGWQGLECPVTRAQIWRLFLGYENPDKQVRSEELQAKRLEYLENLKTLNVSSRKPKQLKPSLHFFPKFELFKNKTVQNSLSLIISLISKDETLRKKSTPAMIIPFFLVFLSEFYPVDLETLNIPDEGPQKLYMNIVEADTYWCSSIFLKTYYHKKESQICENIIKSLQRFDESLFFHIHFEKMKMNFLHRWIKYLFLRDFPMKVCLRIFDELISNKNSKSLVNKNNSDILQHNFIVCLSCALISIFRNQIMISNGQRLEEIMARLPTESWGEIEILILMSQAYLYQSILE